MKIFCVGSATLDIFFIFKNLDFLKGKAKIFEKNNVPEIFIDIGGGALNSAFNLKNLNLNSEAIIKLGDDFVGKIIIKKLEEKEISTKIIKTKGNSTISVIFLNKNTGEKYIFTYRGNEIFKVNEIPVSFASAYLITTGATPLFVWENVIKKIKKKDNFVGLLPSKNFLSKKAALETVKNCDFVVLNEEEAILFLKTKKDMDRLIVLKKFNELLKNVKFKVITFGKEGAYLIHENIVYFVNAFKKTKVVDTTGAGDCFASTLFGFIIKNINKLNKEVLSLALKLSAINTAYNLREIGAQTGLLKEKELLKFKKVDLGLKIFEI